MQESKDNPNNIGSAAVFTVVSNNYLHFARTLLQTVAKHHPNADIYCVIVDKNFEPASMYSNEFTVLSMQDLNIPDLQQMIFQYDVLELNTAVKPWAFEAILNKGYETVVYFDPDIFLYRPISDVMNALNSGADIVITPHLLSPIKDDKRPTELDIRRAGTYNFGFCAVGHSENAFDFLHWWQSKLFRDCIVDQDRGIFVDQSWIDLVPGLFDNVLILRNPAYNVAYWNIGQRVVAKSNVGEWTVDGEPLTFFHYSGFNPLDPNPFSKHQNRFTLATLGPAAELVRAYAEALIANGARAFSKLAYGYANFSDGTVIPATFRRLYLTNSALREQMGDDPFSRSEYLMKPAEGEGVASIIPITWAMCSLYFQRSDLQSKFNLMNVESASNYWNWFIADKSGNIPESLQSLHREKWTLGFPTIQIIERQCYELFANLLDRSPTKHELRKFRNFCSTKLGATSVLILLATKAESRKRPKPTRRFKKALRAVWQVADGRRTQEIAPREASTRRLPITVGSGLYLTDDDSAENGVWCSKHVSIPLGNKKQRAIQILGVYYPSLLESTFGRRALTLKLKLDGQPWKSIVLPENGRIEILEELPVNFSKVRSLQIDADAAFIPAAKGLGTDTRELSWRLKKLNFGDQEIFDSGSEQKLVPVSQIFGPEGFNLIGYVFAELGVGEAARTMARAASAVKIPYSLYDVGFQSENRQSDRSAENAAVDKTFNIDVLYVNADQTANTLRHLAKNRWPHSNYRIGFWHWEQPRLPEKYWNGFEGLDEVWVPTTFVQEAVSAVSPLPVFKVPHAVDFSVDNRWGRRHFGIPENKFAVLVMYDFDSYRFRKNPEAAIAAYKLAARERHDTTLVIKTVNAAKYADDYAALKAEVADLNSVVFIDEFYTREQIYALEANCDCMLSLHRAEGFGFGPAEMMFLGKPVIATGWSGNMDFMTPQNSFPVQYELRPLAEQLGAYAAGLDWAEADIEHAAHCLRKLLEQDDVVREIGKRARYTMRTNYSPEVIGRKYLDRLSAISVRL